MCRARARRRPASPRSTSCRRTRTRSGPRRRRSRPRARWPASSTFYPDGTARRLREAIAEVHGLNPANIICSNGSDEILGLLAQTYLAPGDEAIFTEHGFMVYKIYIQSAGAVPVVGQGDRRARRRRRDPGRGDAADQDRLPRQSQQSDRHLCAVPGGAPPACRPARATCCWCSTRPTPNMSAATTMKPASNWSAAPRTS